MNGYVRMVLALVVVALIMHAVLPVSPAAAAPTQFGMPASNGCPDARYRIHGVWWMPTVRVYLDHCNVTWLIRMFDGVGKGWSNLGKLPHLIAQVFGLLGGAQLVIAAVLQFGVWRCGSQGITIVRENPWSVPYVRCGRVGL